jgi:hypothetical protein
MKTLRFCAVWLCVAFNAFAQDGASLLNRAKNQLEDLEADAAVKTLAQAEKQPGNSRATLEEIHLFRGIANGVLGNKGAMQDAFRWLLVVNSEVKLPKDQPPKVQTPFYEAKAWAETAGPLLLAPSAEISGAKVTALHVKVEKDTLKLAKAVRFHLVADGVNREQEEMMHAGVATTPISAGRVSWWAEVLTENEGVLTTLGTVSAPRVDSATPMTDSVSNVQPTPMVTQTVGSGEWRRPFGAVLLGVGGAAAIAGGVVGVLSRMDRDKVSNAKPDDSGRITSLTQRQAVALENSARTKATAANVLFISGGALAAVGAVFVIWGPDKAPVAQVTPALGGFSVSGSF